MPRFYARSHWRCGARRAAGAASARIERAQHAIAGCARDRREIAGLARGEAVREPREGERLDLLRRPSAAVVSTVAGTPASRSAFRSASSSTGLRAPPPQTNTALQPAACCAISRATDTAVSAVRVACTSSGVTCANAASFASSHAGLNRSRPVLSAAVRRNTARRAARRAAARGRCRARRTCRPRRTACRDGGLPIRRAARSRGRSRSRARRRLRRAGS